MAISTKLLSYLLIFPTVIKLRYSHPDQERPYRVPGGNTGVWIAGIVATAWIALAAWGRSFPTPSSGRSESATTSSRAGA
jgi:amino acid transporter